MKRNIFEQFINYMATGVNVPVGQGLKSSTRKVRTVHADLDGKDILLVDRPGFDDTYMR
jgi:hypothetical protein